MKKEVLKRLAFIGFGIIPIIFVLNSKGPERFIGLIGFLFSMYNLIVLISKSQLILDYFFPPKTLKENEVAFFDKLIYYISMILFFGGLIFEILEIRIIDNTIDGSRLFWKYGFIGSIIGLFLIIIFKLISRTLYNESTRRYSVIFGLLIGLFLLTPALASFINHHYADTSKIIERYSIIRKSSSSGRNHEYYIFCNINNDVQRFSVDKSFWLSVKEDQDIELCLNKGFLGFKTVIEFRVNQDN